MHRADKVRFVDGKRCPKNMQQSKRLPECGIFDRNEFNPINKKDDIIPKKITQFSPGDTLPKEDISTLPESPQIPKSSMPSSASIQPSGVTPMKKRQLDSKRAEVVHFPASRDPAPPRGYTRIPDLGQFEMDTLPSSVDIEAPRTRLFESNPSGNGLRRRIVASTYDSDTRFTTRPSDQLENPMDAFSNEFGPPKGTPSYPADDVPSNVIETNRFLPKSQLRDITTERRAQQKSFLENKRTELHENAKSLMNSLSNVSTEVQEGITMRFADQYRHGYRQISKNASSITGVDMPRFDIESQQPIATSFKDGSFEIEQGSRAFESDVTGIEKKPLMNTFTEKPFEQYDLSSRAQEAFADRLANVNERTGRVSTGVGMVGIGLSIGYGVGSLMNNYHADPYATAFVSSAAGDVGSRYAAIAGQSLTRIAAQKMGVEVGTQVTESIGEQLALSGLRGTAEGGILGIAAMPLDMWLNDVFTNQSHMSHGAAGALASGLTGVGVTGVIGGVGLAGTAAGIEGASILAAPETLGLSLFVAGVTALVSGIVGANMDASENAKVYKLNTSNQERLALVNMLPKNSFDFDSTLRAFQNEHPDQYDKLGVGNDSWNGFKKTLQTSLDNNNNKPAASTKQLSDDDKKVNKLFTQYVTHNLIQDICGGKECAIAKDDPGPLNEDETKFLNGKSKTWQSQADLSAAIAANSSKFHYQETNFAIQVLTQGWNKDRKLPSDYPDSIVKKAEMDSTFMEKFNKAIEADSQRQIIQDYLESGGTTTIDKQPINIQKAAMKGDGSFKTQYDTFTKNMVNTSVKLDVTVPQLIELQSLGHDPSAQSTKYKSMQFENAKENVDVVQQAKAIMKETEQVSAMGFYDIDSAFLDTDPTNISKWQPSDSQIILASNAGMTMNQYVDYLSQLQRGKEGDFSKLPTYTNQQLMSQGIEDYAHLQDELRMAGRSDNMYSYDPKTRKYTLNRHTTPDLKSALAYQSKYSPKYLVEAREQYAKMITNMNAKTKSDVAGYNKALRSHIVNQAYQFQQNAEAYNIHLSRQSTAAYTPLLSMDVDKIYNSNALDYHPLSTSMPSRQMNSPTDVHIVDHHAIDATQQVKKNEPERSPS